MNVIGNDLKMASTKFQEFLPEVDDFNVYKERLEQHFEANGVKDEIKTAILLSSVSQAVYKLIRDLTFPSLPKDKTYAELCNMLKKQYCIQKSAWRERRNFYKIQQDSHESVIEWYARIRSAATECAFENRLEEVLRDKFVSGLSSSKIFDRLCEEEATTELEKLITLAQKIEDYVRSSGSSNVEKLNYVTSNKPSHMGNRSNWSRSAGADASCQNRSSWSSGSRSVGSPQQSDSRQTSSQKKISKPYFKNSNFNKNFTKSQNNFNKNNYKANSCRICGNKHKGMCFYKNHICKICRKTGHIEKLCYKNRNNMHFVDEITDSEEVDVLYSEVIRNNQQYKSQINKNLELLNINKSNPFIIKIKIDNKIFNMLLDTGSAISALSYDVYLKHLSHFRLVPETVVLRGYDGSTFMPKGSFKAKVEYQNIKKSVKFYIVEGGGPSLLGRDWLDGFKISLETINHVAMENEVDKIISKYPNVFCEQLGKLKSAKVKLYLKDEAKPLFIKYRNPPIAYRELIDEELDKLLKDGVISPIDSSEWATPAVPILKNDGKVRLCGNYKITVNKYLKEVTYPLPLIHDLFAKLNKGEKFSKIDLSKAYNQLELDEESGNILTLNTHRGLFRMNRLPFGITTASSIFQKHIDMLFQGMDGVVAYIDDVLVTGKNNEEHLKNLEKVIEKLAEAGLTVKKEKCEFFKDEINYLGHKISKEGLKKSDDKVKAILNAPRPTNITEVRKLAGLVNYYHKFIPNIAKMMQPIYK